MIRRFLVAFFVALVVLVYNPMVASAATVTLCNQSGESQSYHLHNLFWVNTIENPDGQLGSGNCVNITVFPKPHNLTDGEAGLAVDIDSAGGDQYYGVHHIVYRRGDNIKTCTEGPDQGIADLTHECVVGRWNGSTNQSNTTLTYYGRNGKCSNQQFSINKEFSGDGEHLAANSEALASLLAKNPTRNFLTQELLNGNSKVNFDDSPSIDLVQETPAPGGSGKAAACVTYTATWDGCIATNNNSVGCMTACEAAEQSCE